MDKIYKVYRIDHKIDGELQAVYIGYTSQTLRCRLNQHLHDKTCKFGQYWLAYTNNNHRTHLDELSIYKLVSTDVKTDAIALEEEQTENAIKIYGEKCLNDSIGYRRSEKHRKKTSEAHKGMKLSEEAKKKISEANKGRKFSEAYKKKMSDTLKGKFKGSKHPLAQSCEYDGRTFGCIREAYWYAQEHGYTKTYEAFWQMIKKQSL